MWRPNEVLPQKKEKFCIDRLFGEYFILRKIWAKQDVSEKVWFLPKTALRFETVRKGATLGNPSIFYSHLRLEAIFAALKLSQSFYINMKIGSPSPSRVLYLKGNPHNRAKYESKIASKIPVFQFLSELGKMWKYSLSYYSKSQLKSWQMQQEKHSKTLIFNLFVNRKKLGSLTKTKIKKSQFWIYGWIEKSYVLIQVSLLKIRSGIYTRLAIFQTFPKFSRIYQWFGIYMFSIRKKGFLNPLEILHILQKDWFC